MRSMEEEESSDFRGQHSRQISHASLSLNFAEIARIHLRDYHDIDEEEFQMVDQDEQSRNALMLEKMKGNSYMKLHNTIVPIGPTYQAEIPDPVSAKTYLYRSQPIKRRLKMLKIHEPQENNMVYNMNYNFIAMALGERSYEEIVMIYKCYKDYPEPITFQEYLSTPDILIFWKNYFEEKRKMELSKKKKKKKSKGSIPI